MAVILTAVFETFGYVLQDTERKVYVFLNTNGRTMGRRMYIKNMLMRYV